MGYAITVEQGQPAIANALADLLRNLPNKHRLNVIEQFEKVHDVKIQEGASYSWSLIEFRDQEHYIEWYLRWA